MGVVGSGFSQAITNAVFRAKASFQGVIQSGPTPASQTLQPVQINSEDLVNFALGREQGTKLQANELLALAASLTTNTSRLFVYDSSTTSNLATIGLINPQVVIFGQKHRQTTLAISAPMIIPGAGNATNGLTGGSFLLEMKSVFNTNNSTANFSAKLIGFLGVAVPGTNATILVRSGTISTQGQSIGTLVEQP